MDAEEPQPQNIEEPQAEEVKEEANDEEGAPPQEEGEQEPMEESSPQQLEVPEEESPQQKEKTQKKSTGSLLAESPADDTQKELVDAFYYMDRRKQGKLAINLLEEVTGMMGISFPPPDKREPIIKLADPNGTGFFTLSTLKQVVNTLKEGSTNADDIVTAYRLFDKEGKGYFTQEELRTVLMRFTAGGITDAEITQIMSMAGGGGVGEDGQPQEATISKDTFLSLFQ